MIEIEIKGLSKSYDKVTALHPLELSIRPGEMFGILGINGAGKTTLVHLLCGLLKPDSGDALIGGKSIVTEADSVRPILNISPQQTAVAPKLTVKENLIFSARLYGTDAKNAEKKAEEMLKIFSLESVARRPAGKLSGGQQRKLSIAMATVTEPSVLFLDEPTLGLDVLARRELWEVIRALKGKVTMTLTTHYLEEAEALCDRIAILANGKLVAMGTTTELMRQAGKENFEEAFITLCKEGNQ